MCINVLCACMLCAPVHAVPTDARGGIRISYRLFCGAIWVLRIVPRSRGATSLN